MFRWKVSRISPWIPSRNEFFSGIPLPRKWRQEKNHDQIDDYNLWGCICTRWNVAGFMSISGGGRLSSACFIRHDAAEEDFFQRLINALFCGHRRVSSGKTPCQPARRRHFRLLPQILAQDLHHVHISTQEMEIKYTDDNLFLWLTLFLYLKVFIFMKMRV